MARNRLRIHRCLTWLLLILLTAVCPAHAGHEEHLLLAEKDMGVCTDLTGEVRLQVVFVSVGDTQWEADALTAMQQELRTAADVLAAEAAAWGAELTLHMDEAMTCMPETASMSQCEEWASQALESAALPAHDDGAAYADTPVIFCLNVPGRAFARTEYSRRQAEFLILFDGDDEAAIRHELLHLYGACDYYMPADVTLAARRHCPDSIMLDALPEHRTDSLTAYIIGWTDDLDSTALSLLQDTQHVTYEDSLAALELSTFTGYAAMEFPNGTYTGMLTEGYRNGQGAMVWDNGDTYTGEWRWNEPHGTGEYRWASGSSYTGDFLDGERTGRGVFIWAGGDSYTGDFLNGERHGQGIHTWSSGNSYSGSFVHNQRTGQGVYTWSDGSSYSGDFLDGKRHGQGTFTWSDGSSYSGGFLNNEFSGHGVYSGADGTVLEGLWEAGQLVK